MSVIVSPSLLAADFMNLGKDVEMVDRSKADWIHLDIMDAYSCPIYPMVYLLYLKSRK